MHFFCCLLIEPQLTHPHHKRIFRHTMHNGLVYLLYNSEAQIRRNFNSIVHTKYPLKLHIIDNASTDNAAKLLTDAGYPVHRNEQNNYYSAGINQGLEALLKHDLDWIFLVNPDAQLHENWDSEIVDCFTQKPEVGIVGCRLTTPTGELTHTGGIVGKPKPVFWETSYQLGDGWEVVQPDVVTSTGYRHDLRDHKEPRRTTWVTFCVVALRVNMLREIGLLDTMAKLYCSDITLCLRAANSGWETWYNPYASFVHEVSANVKAAGSEVHEVAKADLRRFALMEADKTWLL